MEKIDFIQKPYVFTNEGNRYHFGELKGEPRVGSGIDADMNVINTGSVDVDCPGGKCPIK